MFEHSQIEFTRLPEEVINERYMSVQHREPTTPEPELEFLSAPSFELFVERELSTKICKLV